MLIAVFLVLLQDLLDILSFLVIFMMKEVLSVFYFRSGSMRHLLFYFYGENGIIREVGCGRGFHEN